MYVKPPKYFSSQCQIMKVLPPNFLKCQIMHCLPPLQCQIMRPYNKSQENYIEYENIFEENVKMIRKVYQNFKTNYDIKENQKKSLGSPRDPLCDPLFSLLECSNGNII